MSTELVSAIDRAVSYAKDHSDAMTRSEVGEFIALGADVYKLAKDENLLATLPQVPELRPELESHEFKLPPVQFISKLNLPGDWDTPVTNEELLPPQRSVNSEPTELPDASFMVCLTPRWLEDMQMLAVLAGGKSKSNKAEGSLDSRAVAIFMEDNTLTKTQIAKRLGLNFTQSLSRERCPRLDDLMNAYKELGPPRGSKSTEGQMEAWDQD